MKPTNKFERRLVDLSKTLSPISEKQKTYAKENCFKSLAFATNKKSYCMDCGCASPVVLEDGEISYCPNCGHSIKVEHTRKRKHEELTYFCVAQTRAEFQVLRFFYIKKECKVGKAAYYFIDEVVQHWISPDGSLKIMARNAPMSYCIDSWNFWSPISLKKVMQDRYNIFEWVTLPGARLTSQVKRNGVDRCAIKELPTSKLICYSLSDTVAETLLKSKQYKWFRAYMNGVVNKNEYWTQIKICIKNSYLPKDIDTWADYIDLLKFFGKDIRNAKYVCPKDLKKEHDRLVVKKREFQRKEEEVQKRLRAETEEKNFRRMRGKYFGVLITDGDITIKPFGSVKEVMEEGDILKHCVFTNDYYKKENSLLLSARKDNTPIETIELSLKDFSIKQCRGKHNQNSPYHDRIVDLVKNNIKYIKRAKKQKITA